MRNLGVMVSRSRSGMQDVCFSLSVSFFFPLSFFLSLSLSLSFSLYLSTPGTGEGLTPSSGRRALEGKFSRAPPPLARVDSGPAPACCGLMLLLQRRGRSGKWIRSCLVARTWRIKWLILSGCLNCTHRTYARYDLNAFICLEFLL